MKLENINVDLTFKQMQNALLSLLIENLAQNKLLFEELLALRVRIESGFDNENSIKYELNRYDEKFVQTQYDLAAQIISKYSLPEKTNPEKFISDTVAYFEVFLTDLYKNIIAMQKDDADSSK